MWLGVVGCGWVWLKDLVWGSWVWLGGVMDIGV